MDDRVDKFAEVDIEATPNRSIIGENDLRLILSAPPAVPVVQRATDPIRLKFYEMRSLASDRPFARSDSELFYKQAKFMEDFSDEYEGSAYLKMYFPYYQHMGYEQLRTYFTWRTKVRQGEVLKTSVSYAFLYVYELLSGIGVDDPLDGLNKLVVIWDKFLQYGPVLAKYLPKWFKDYHVYYNLPHSFEGFVLEHGLQALFPEMFLFDKGVENSLELWNCISGYDVTGSKFYKAGNEQLMRDCFKYVLDGIRDLCESIGMHYEELFIYQYSRAGHWYPFRQALFHPWQHQLDRRVDMPGKERYQCKNDRWAAYLPIYYSDQRHIIGRILKKMEASLRQAVKYKFKLKAEPCAFFRSSATPIIFDDAIERAVTDFHNDLTRTVVTVDNANLARIRKEALGTQEKLIVEEGDGGRGELRVERGELGDGGLGELGVGRGEETISDFVNGARDIVAQQLDDVASGGLDSAAERAQQLHTPHSTLSAKLDERSDSPWDALKESLSDVELKALSIALHDDVAGVKAFADERGVMLEVLADGINEKAADYLGDSILNVDEGIVIYDEYRESIVAMVAL